jgi:predicted HD phosphohydrolase
LSPEVAEEYYRARKVWLEMARQNAIQFKLNEGDLIILDNERVMHGRTEILASDGDSCTGRFLEGCYIDKDGVTSRYFLRKSAGRTNAVSVGRRLVSANMVLATQKTSGQEVEIPDAEVTFRSLSECSQQDVRNMTDNYTRACSAEKLTQRAVGMLQSADNAQKLGCAVSLREHCLQSASRALVAGASDEIVVAALLHDVGELLSPSSHGEIPAAMLAPYVSPETHWVMAHHEIFQMHYYAHHLGMDPNTRDQYVDHPYFEACRKFCEDYDAPSFDPDYPTMPLEQFVPILHRVFSLEAYWWDHNHPKRGAVVSQPQQFLSKL